MTRHYREQYGYTGGPVHHGYPRDDALTGGDAAGVRRPPGPGSGSVTTRPRSCTPRPGATTWPPGREARHSPTTWTCLAPPTCWATATCCCCAGTGSTPCPRRTPPAGGSARVLDVTGHPEVNDLVLASDVAVLDYSSLRFDYAQTGKPMVFLVPDLDSYSGALRGFLFPFEESAPGPFAATTAEVVEQVRDVDGLPLGWAHRLAEFNAAYNPGRTARPPSGSWTGCEACCECARAVT